MEFIFHYTLCLRLINIFRTVLCLSKEIFQREWKIKLFMKNIDVTFFGILLQGIFVWGISKWNLEGDEN